MRAPVKVRAGSARWYLGGLILHPYSMSQAMLGNRALKVGVFYDGSYFSHVSNYYNYVHGHHRRLHIGGLHDFIKHMVADREGVTPNLCHIIDAHFFRGRFSARDANAQMERGERITFVDFRNEKARAEADTKLPEAIRVPADDAAKHSADIPRDRAVVTYCT